jgi:hypothetical protein
MSGRRSRRIADFDEQKLMMRPSGRKRGRLPSKNPADLFESQKVAVKG